ncbi:MAG: hypothetical protein ACC634_04975, partial [Hyphomicrobiales bacterium]
MITGASTATAVFAAVSAVGRSDSTGVRATGSQPGESQPGKPEGTTAPRAVAPASSANKPKGADDKLNEE